MKIPENILAILAECRIEDNTLFLPQGQLDRKVYEAVNKCLTNIGGKWNRKTKGHVFDNDPAEALESLLLTGETEDMKKLFQFYPTPRELGEVMCDLAELPEPICENANDIVSRYIRILEPSIGEGDLADVIYERGFTDVFGVELNKEMAKYLDTKPYTSITGVDFLEFAKEAADGKVRRNFTHVVMNPPFTKQQDIDHILAAFELLEPGGILVSVVSTSPWYRDNKKSKDFIGWLDTIDAEVIDVPAGAFKASGTNIPTKIIKVRKEGTLEAPPVEDTAKPQARQVSFTSNMTFVEKFNLTKAS